MELEADVKEMKRLLKALSDKIDLLIKSRRLRLWCCFRRGLSRIFLMGSLTFAQLRMLRSGIFKGQNSHTVFMFRDCVN